MPETAPFHFCTNCVFYPKPEATFYEMFRLLDSMAQQCSDIPEVVGFRVCGPKEPYEQMWNTDSRSPLRWRSGEWELVPSGAFAMIVDPTKAE